MRISYLILMLLAASTFLAGICSATAGPAITISPPAVTLTSGSSVTYNFRISGLEAGLAGYRMQVKVTNPDAGQITAVSFPDWATGPKVSHLPSDNVTVSATDLGHQVEDGASGVTLVSVTVTATGAGTANIKIQNLTMQDDHSGTFTPDLSTARLTSRGDNESASQPGASPSSADQSVTLQTGTNNSLNQSFQPAIPTTLSTASPSVSPGTTTIPVSAADNIPQQKETLPQVPVYQRVPRMALVGFGLVALIAAIALLYLGTTRKI
ncbi:MAG TPA: hypothetical protein VMC42_08095 [Methanoregulaceae archaeon]|nr:hypothetical protein [Methanoregulaceae archaeon]